MRRSLPGRLIKAIRRRTRRFLRPFLAGKPKPQERDRPHREPFWLALKELKSLIAAGRATSVRITCGGRLDGAGAQAMAFVSALAFAQENDCEYLHTPFRKVAHAEGDEAAWTARWEAFLGLGYGEAAVPADARLVPLIKYVRQRKNRWRRRRDERIVVHSRYFTAPGLLAPDAYHRLKPRLQAKYFSTDKSAIPLLRSPGRLTVAMHVRRGDLPGHSRRYMPDPVNLNTIALLRSALGSLGCEPHIHLFSQGSPDMFRAYSEAGCELHLDTDVFAALHNLITADILIGARSGFSHLAALISNGIVIDPFGDASISVTRIQRTDDGGFDAAQFVRAFHAWDGWKRKDVSCR